MPLSPLPLDTRTFPDIVAQLVRRIPIHNPEWTNFSRNDPGITILEVAAFLLENDIYVANQIPERNRRKFLELLGVPLQPATAARGLVAFADDRGPPVTLTFNEGIELRAQAVPFRTERGLDVLPIEAQAYFKKAVDRPELLDYYKLLHASQTVPPADAAISLYETTALGPDGFSPDDAIDRSLWIGLFARQTEKDQLDAVRQQIAGRTLSLGVVPSLQASDVDLLPQKTAGTDAKGTLRVFLPKLPPGGLLSEDQPQPSYQALQADAVSDVTIAPGIVEVALPSNPSDLSLWQNLGPLDSGVGDFPPSIDDTEQSARILTWLRVRSPVDLLWVGINCTQVTQRAHVAGEALQNGTGDPDQQATLARAPVLPETVRIFVTADAPDASAEEWQEIDDLFAAGPEVPAPDPRLPPGTALAPNDLVNVFAVDPEAGAVKFGDGLRGARPALGARIRADYDYGVGKAGNVGAGAINAGPSLPGGFTVTNPVPTWGGADAETPDQGEKQIPRYLQHHDRLVSAEDFEVLTWRTPGVDLGRVEVLPAFHPDLSPNLPGDAAGVVTVVLIPNGGGEPDQALCDAVAAWLDPRRLVTTELVLSGPVYVPVQVSVAVEVVPGMAPSTVQQAVKQTLTDFLSPLPPPGTEPLDDRAALLTTPAQAAAARGWPLGKAVQALELQAVASRVPGVQLVHPVDLYKVTLPADPTGQKTLTLLDPIAIDGLALPQILAVQVGIGDTPPSFDDVGESTPATTVPVPIIPETC
ncbi:MAG TPA: putative baseplate assembly protein [Myxococcales bacterium]